MSFLTPPTSIGITLACPVYCGMHEETVYVCYMRSLCLQASNGCVGAIYIYIASCLTGWKIIGTRNMLEGDQIIQRALWRNWRLTAAPFHRVGRPWRLLRC